jgi:hypothetical protein
LVVDLICILRVHALYGGSRKGKSLEGFLLIMRKVLYTDKDGFVTFTQC